MMCLLLLVGMSSVSFAQTTTGKGIVDPSGDARGDVDIIGAAVEMYERTRGSSGDETLMKLTITVAGGDNLPGAIIFEADVDDSIGTGGTIGQLGSPVSPCPCKTTPGMDLAITTYHRRQGDDSGSAFCATCVGGPDEPLIQQGTPCERRREAGEWYALTSLSGQPFRALGILRGLNDPIPQSVGSGATEQSYTFPYDTILAYANFHLIDEGFIGGERFNYTKAHTDPVTNCKWQVSAYYDPAYAAGSNEDDVVDGSGLSSVFNISDWAPNGDGVLADALAADGITYCEGNFDQDGDVDGTDASVFKSNFGRGGYTNPCPTANQYH